ncbi:MAG: CGNR zinc finger domain-containing protein [Anaerolineae bacterium]|nr:CGNR zinc finger domain-containing protein [Anaerolineae bacterium]
MTQEQSVSKFIIIANHLCLDFINTQIIQGGQLVELLEDFTDLVGWLAAVQLLDAAQAEEAISRWNNTGDGQHVFERALTFRATLRDIAKQIVAGQPVSPAVVEDINKLLRYRIHYSELISGHEGFTTRSYAEFDEAIHLLTPIAEAASELLCSADFSLIKKCENPECILYFYDTSKNHKRRWCSMSICGNRMKVAAYYRRHRPTPEDN